MLNMDEACGMLFPVDLNIIEILHNLYKLADTKAKVQHKQLQDLLLSRKRGFLQFLSISIYRYTS